jgi:hypothetical protein
MKYKSLSSALEDDKWSDSHPPNFILGEKGPCYYWIQTWVGLRASLDAVQKRKIS